MSSMLRGSWSGKHFYNFIRERNANLLVKISSNILQEHLLDVYYGKNTWTPFLNLKVNNRRSRFPFYEVIKRLLFIVTCVYLEQQQHTEMS